MLHRMETPSADFPIALLPGAVLRHENDVWMDTTHPLLEASSIDRATYDERSRAFSLDRAFDCRRPQFTQPLRSLGAAATFLEIAAGRAAHSLRLLRDGYRVIVSDVSPESVRWVKRTAEHFGIHGHGLFCVLDALHLPFADGTLDGIFLTASLHHLPDPAAALKEMRRVLRPGGVLLVGYEPARWTYRVFAPLWRRLKALLRRRDPARLVSQMDDETEGFTMSELRNLARGAGFTDITVSGVDFLEKIYEHAITLIRKIRGVPDSEYRPDSRILRVIDRVLGSLPLVRRLAWNYDLRAQA